VEIELHAERGRLGVGQVTMIIRDQAGRHLDYRMHRDGLARRQLEQIGHARHQTGAIGHFDAPVFGNRYACAGSLVAGRDERTIAARRQRRSGRQATFCSRVRALPSSSMRLSWLALVRATAVMPWTKSKIDSGGRPSSASTVSITLPASALEKPRF